MEYRVSLSGKGEVCKSLRKSMAVYCLHKLRCRVQGSRMLRIEGRRFKLWWSRNEDGVASVGAW